jgi:hypothetical protein
MLIGGRVKGFIYVLGVFEVLVGLAFLTGYVLFWPPSSPPPFLLAAVLLSTSGPFLGRSTSPRSGISASSARPSPSCYPQHRQDAKRSRGALVERSTARWTFGFWLEKAELELREVSGQGPGGAKGAQLPRSDLWNAEKRELMAFDFCLPA